MISPHHVTCQPAIAAANHKIITAEWWADPVYRAVEAQFLHNNPVCEYCGRPSTVAHHDNPNSYKSKAEYYKPENMTPACARCHHEYRCGKVICPICRQHYIQRDGPRDRCRWCRGIKQPGLQSRYKYRQNHPCNRRIGKQRCQRTGRVFVCGYSAKKCRACDHFEERKPGARA